MSTSPKFPTEHDLELLSAFLDGELSDRERAALEQRLAVDNALRAELDSLRHTVLLVGNLPTLRAPRNFTLDPALYARALPWWQRLFNFNANFALQTLGALGTAASIVILTIALVSGGGLDRTTERDSQSAAEPASVGADAVAQQVTAEAATTRDRSGTEMAEAEESTSILVPPTRQFALTAERLAPTATLRMSPALDGAPRDAAAEAAPLPSLGATRLPTATDNFLDDASGLTMDNSLLAEDGALEPNQAPSSEEPGYAMQQFEEQMQSGESADAPPALFEGYAPSPTMLIPPQIAESAPQAPGPSEEKTAAAGDAIGDFAEGNTADEAVGGAMPAEAEAPSPATVPDEAAQQLAAATGNEMERDAADMDSADEGGEVATQGQQVTAPYGSTGVSFAEKDETKGLSRNQVSVLAGIVLLISLSIWFIGWRRAH